MFKKYGLSLFVVSVALSLPFGISEMVILLWMVNSLVQIYYKRNHYRDYIRQKSSITRCVIPIILYFFLVTFIGLILSNLNLKDFLNFILKYLCIPTILIQTMVDSSFNLGFKKITIMLLSSTLFGFFEWYFGYNPIVNLIDIDAKEWLISMNNSKVYQSSSIYLHYNYFSLSLLFSWVILKIAPFENRYINWVNKILIAFMIVVNQSRIAWITFVLILIVDFYLSFRSKRILYNKNYLKVKTNFQKIGIFKYVLYALIFFLTIYLFAKLGSFVWARFEGIFYNGFKNGSLGQRVGTFLNWHEYLLNNPVEAVFGTGFNSINHYYMKLYSYFPGYSTADSTYTIFLVDFGLLISLYILRVVFKYVIPRIIRSIPTDNGVSVQLFLIITIEGITIDLLANNFIATLLVLAIILIYHILKKENI